MKENPVRFKYVCARALLHITVSKMRCISREIQKSVALAGLLFLRKKGITLIFAMQGIDLFLLHVNP